MKLLSSSSLALIFSVLCTLATGVVARTQKGNRKLKKSPEDKPGKDYWKAKRYFKKFAKVQPPDNDYYLFYSFIINCKIIDSFSPVEFVSECDVANWDGTILGKQSARCYMIEEIDTTASLLEQDPELACDRFIKFESGNYFFEKFMFSNSDPVRRSIIVGGTGTFVDASGESIIYQPYDPKVAVDFTLYGQPLPPVPQIWLVKSLNAKEVAFDFWKGFDPDDFFAAPPDFSVLPEWYTNSTNS